MKRFVFVLIFLSLGFQHKVLSQPVVNQKPELLIFSGSDWCIPCIKFDRQVRQNEQFRQFARANLKITVADFPQHNKLAEETQRINESLAERFNPNGLFPFVLLLNNEGEILTRIKTNNTSALDVINQIRPYLTTPKLVERSVRARLMGSNFEITIVASSAIIDSLLSDCIAEIQGIESWLSGWQEGSITTEVNRNAAAGPVIVSAEFYQLVERCQQISLLTQGAFDITFAGLGSLYEFDRQEHSLPEGSRITAALNCTGNEFLNLQEGNRISFTRDCINIGFGAIGKGFAADQVRKKLIDKGVTGGVINASGDITLWGARADGSQWQVGVPDPDQKEDILLGIPLNDKAIATSGDYEKYFINDGIRYSHIINPKTGYPVVGSRSVTVISQSAEFSDALATAVSVLGLEVGLDLVNQLAGVECIFIDNNRKLHFSAGLKAYANQP